MLKKLIKYDLKYMNRFLILIHAFLLIFAAAVRIFITGKINANTNEDNMQILFALAFIFSFMLLMAASMATCLVTAIRFYRNLFTDEGYLTRTLPVTSTQHLLSKTISGTVWMFLDIVCIVLGMFLIIWTPFVNEFYTQYRTDIMTELGFTGKYANISVPFIVCIIILYALIGAVSSIVMIYSSIAVGQLFSSHRVIGALAMYFVIQTVISVLSLIFLACFGKMSNFFYLAAADREQFNFAVYMSEVLKLSTILIILTTVPLYLVTQYIMKKKINLL